MLIPNNKINVFISSACGEGREKYNKIRKQLKALIETTGLAKVYIFEDETASTLSANQHYLYALEDSDVCIFLIDNADGVPSGVQAEVDCVKKYNIKSLYYFCDQDSLKPTHLQKSLTGAKFAKSKVIHSFDDFIQDGAQALIDDLILIYKSYCRGRLEAFDGELSDIRGFKLEDNLFKTALVTPKSIIDKTDKCKNFFYRLIAGRDNEVKNTSTLDDWCLQFLPILFDGKSINNFNMSLFLKELQKNQSKEYHNAISKRWDAIQAYFSGDLQATVSLLEDALKYAKETNLPDWIIKDILIDLRNQRGYLGESRNTYSFDDEAQNEIANSEQALYYPLIDRIHNTLNEKYIENILKEKIKSPFTVSFGHNLDQYTDLLSSSYIIAMFNGSLTHILLLYKQIKLIAFYLCQMFDDWNFRILLLKGAILNGSESEIDGITKTFPEILVRMNAEDASAIFTFCNNKPIPYQNLISKLLAYKVTGYFLKDEEFDLIWTKLYAEINAWFKNDNRVSAVGDYLFSCLGGVVARTKQDELAEICCTLLEKKFIRWYDKMFQFVYEYLNLDELSDATAQKLISNIISILTDGDTKNHVNHLEQVLFKFRKQRRVLTEELNRIISEQMPHFYNDTYKLETTDEEEKDIPKFFKNYIEEINRQNNEQGKNGKFYGFGLLPHATIRSILMKSECTFESEMLDKAFMASAETLLLGTQDIQAKCDAIDLLVLLCIKFPDTIQRNSEIINTLKNQRSVVQTGNGRMFMSNLTEAVLQFSSLLLYHCLGEKTWLKMIELLPYFQDSISSQIRVCRTINGFLEVDSTMPIDINMESVFLQHAIGWAASENLDVRWYAIKILILLLRNSDNASIVCSQVIRAVDSDNLYIKNLILRKSFNNHSIDKATREYIFSKCTTDTNFVVRKICFELNNS